MTINGSFVFGTLNSGTNVNDYGQLIRDRDNASATSPNLLMLSDQNDEEKQLLESIATVRDKLLTETARDLVYAADVFALQEVPGDNRADITEFKNHGFNIIRPPKKDKQPNNIPASHTDTAIAINPKKFLLAEDTNRSFNDKYRDFAVAVAVERTSQKKFAFISGHIKGFNLEEKNQKIIRQEATVGDEDILRLIKKLKEICRDCDTMIIGADMNACPEIHPYRFKLLTDAGFTIHRTHKPTNNLSRNFGGTTATLQERELDYVFVYNKNTPNRFFSFFKNLFKEETVQVTKILKNRTNLSLDPISSPSDHIPVFVKVKEVVNQSLFHRILNCFDKLKQLFI